MDNTKAYKDSILLIGPSGAGKSTIAEILSKKLNLPRLCLDRIANQDRESGFRSSFKSPDEYSAFMIKRAIENAKKTGMTGIVDFGAGHSVYEDLEIFNEIKKLLSEFKNIVLLLPSPDIEKSIEILEKRSTGDFSTNREFITSPCNRELATMIVYENGRTPDEIASEIIKTIEDRNKTINEKSER